MLEPTYPITTDRLYLRPFTDNDLDAVYAYQSSPKVVQYLYWNVRTRKESKTALEEKKTRTVLDKEDAVLCLAVCLQNTDEVIGEVLLFWRSEEHKQGEVGYAFNPKFSGHGYATEAAQAMLALGFDDLGLHRIFGRCDARNIASYKLMERLGMRREAHFKHNEMFKGEWGEELIYAILESEWQEQ